MKLDAGSRTTLLRAARLIIEHCLDKAEFAFENYSPDPILQAPCSSFVTLRRHNVLRGCIGTLEPRRPLLDDVIHNARAAAFEDPRFPPLTRPELESLRIEISVLSATQLIVAGSRDELLHALKPGKDGLIVQDGARRATFLPSTWESLPDPGIFYDELMKKAGLSLDYWSSALRFFRYHTESFG